MTFNIIKHFGDAGKVTLVDGTVIHKDPAERLFVPEYGVFVKCAPYGNHFIFEVPKRIKGPSWMCSCGSVAHMVGANAYGHLSSPEGAMIVCQHHTQFNKHADGSK